MAKANSTGELRIGLTRACAQLIAAKAVVEGIGRDDELRAWDLAVQVLRRGNGVHLVVGVRDEQRGCLDFLQVFVGEGRPVDDAADRRHYRLGVQRQHPVLD